MSKTCPHCGCSFDAKEKPRSYQQLKRFFAIVRQAWHHWPEYAKKVDSEDDLRRWLTMSAGYRKIGARIPLKGINSDAAKMLFTEAIKGAGAYAHPVVFDDELIIWTPRSIAFNSMGPSEFNDLCDKVSDVIEAQTGLRVEDMMKETA